ncbi:hypothetical protein GQ55_1G345800 [Panicum hallii var. hallii]|uniref:Uncharacterized protein n=1 Tax=Panicum hallii var. hallii TaxID=1504633 RepID=A0A2T7FAL8_9POAL|nr:hypothetical protein GQ55_1G345800 [Panicum hallii var. hallii]
MSSGGSQQSASLRNKLYVCSGLGLHEQLIRRWQCRPRGARRIELEGHGWFASCTYLSFPDPSPVSRGMFLARARGWRSLSVPGLQTVCQLSTPAEVKRMARNCVHNGPDHRRLNEVLPV